MNRFSEVTYNQLEGTATIGAGLRWEEVYDALDPFGVSVLGGRVPDVGVAGMCFFSVRLLHKSMIVVRQDSHWAEV